MGDEAMTRHHDDQDEIPPGIRAAFRERRALDDRRDGEGGGDPAIRVQWSIVFQVLGYVLGLFVIYNALTNRMTATETRMDTLKSDVSEMKADIKTLLRSTK